MKVGLHIQKELPGSKGKRGKVSTCRRWGWRGGTCL